MIDLILGIGLEGNRLAKDLSSRFDAEHKAFLCQGERGALFVKRYKTVEEQEQNFDIQRAEEYLSGWGTVEDKILVALSGRETISAATLKILSVLKDAEITILFLRDSSAVLRKNEKLHEKVLFGVLQEYTRSGIFKEMIIVDEAKVKDLVGDVPILKFKQKKTEIVCSTIHMSLILREQESLFEPIIQPEETERILTVGVVDIGSGDEKVFFDLEPLTNKSYLFLLSEDTLNNDVDLMDKIDSAITQKASEVISSGVYQSTFSSDYAYVVCYTSVVQ